MEKENIIERASVFNSEDFSKMSVAIEEMGKEGFLFKETRSYPEGLEFEEDYSSKGYTKVCNIEGMIDGRVIQMVRIQRFLEGEDDEDLLVRAELESTEFRDGMGIVLSAETISRNGEGFETEAYSSLSEKFERYEEVACDFCRGKLYAGLSEEDLEKLVPSERKDVVGEILKMIKTMEGFGFDEAKNSDYDYGKMKKELKTGQQNEEGDILLRGLVYPIR